MEVIIISLVALAASLLTFFSGFGLGTLLLPAFAFFFPIPLAIALTALVHFSNNIFKSIFLFKNVDWKIFWSFGIFSVPAAIIGAILLRYLGAPEPLITYNLFQKNHVVHLQGITIGFLMIFFAIYEYFPGLDIKIRPGKNLWLGGLVSGFFGGLTGHQGAIRSAWLIKILNDKHVYIATGTMLACVVDLSRMGVYWKQFSDLNFSNTWQYISFPCTAAFLGAILGNRWIKKITIESVKLIVCSLLILFGLLTITGLLSK